MKTLGSSSWSIMPRPGHTLTEIEDAVDAGVQKFISEGPTAEEMQKATSGVELSFLRGLESNLGKANQLIDGACFMAIRVISALTIKRRWR